jgi:hypothetical protein
MFGGGRGLNGTVTQVAADHYTIKTDAGETYTVHFSANTRIVKQAAGRGSGGGQSQSGGGESGGSGNPPQRQSSPLTSRWATRLRRGRSGRDSQVCGRGDCNADRPRARQTDARDAGSWPSRAQRKRQDHAAQPDRLHRPTHQRPGAHRWRGHFKAEPTRMSALRRERSASSFRPSISFPSSRLPKTSSFRC